MSFFVIWNSFNTLVKETPEITRNESDYCVFHGLTKTIGILSLSLSRKISLTRQLRVPKPCFTCKITIAFNSLRLSRAFPKVRELQFLAHSSFSFNLIESINFDNFSSFSLIFYPIFS